MNKQVTLTQDVEIGGVRRAAGETVAVEPGLADVLVRQRRATVSKADKAKATSAAPAAGAGKDDK